MICDRPMNRRATSRPALSDSDPAWLAQASSTIQGREVPFEGIDRGLEHAAAGVNAADVEVSPTMLVNELGALVGEQRVGCTCRPLNSARRGVRVRGRARCPVRGPIAVQPMSRS
jgi:hypothetical protein